MGQKQNEIMNEKFNSNLYAPDRNSINRNSFEFIVPVGRGGFGKVWKVMLKKYKKYYAMKEMSKKRIIDKHSDTSIKNEREFLSKMFHPFIVNMHYAFQDKDNLYLVMDYLGGGDLRYHFCCKRTFNENETKFLCCCLILSLEYIHSNSIIHRDIKPENLVMDNKGYLKLTDFGVARVYKKFVDNSKETSGTPGYMAPEVLCGLNHGLLVDYYALGIITYELMHSHRPYIGKNRKEIKEKVMSHQVKISKNNILPGWSEECADFINRLIQRKPACRLGAKGIEEIKQHPWLKFFNWKDLYLMKMQAPLIPEAKDNYDRDFCNKIEKIGSNTKERYTRIEKGIKFKICFQDYLYFDRNKIKVLTINGCEEVKKEENSIINNEPIKEKALDILNENGIKSRNENKYYHPRTVSLEIGMNSIKSYNNVISNFKSQDDEADEYVTQKVYNNPHLIYYALEQKEKESLMLDKVLNKNNKRIIFFSPDRKNMKRRGDNLSDLNDDKIKNNTPLNNLMKLKINTSVNNKKYISSFRLSNKTSPFLKKLKNGT